MTAGLKMCLPIILIGILSLGGCATQKVGVPRSSGGDYFAPEPFLTKPDTESAQQQAEGLAPTGPIEDMEWRSAEPETPADMPAPQVIVKVEKLLLLPSVTEVDQRMAVYAEKLSGWETLADQIDDLDFSERKPSRWSQCYADIGKLFRDYSLLMEMVLKYGYQMLQNEELEMDPWRVFYDDIAFIEGGCEDVFVAGASLVSNWENRYSDSAARQSEAIIGQYAGKGRYQEAILAFQNLMSSYPDRDVSVNTRKMYGLALLKTGQLERAAKVLSETLARMASSAEERSLRRLVADLMLASGRLDESRENYRSLADFYESRKGDDRWVADQLALLGTVDLRRARELPLYMDVLRDYIAFDGKIIPEGMKDRVERLEEGFPESPFTDRARQMFGQTEDSVRDWGRIRLEEVDTFVAEHDYVQAKSALELMLVDDLEPAMAEVVQRTMDHVVQAEKLYQEEQLMLLEQSLAQQWDKAVNLHDSRKYDEAIAAFEALFNTDYDVPAREKIKDSAESASVDMRRKAANLFVQARKARDYSRKRELLKESWGLLNDIARKYPKVKLIDKVKQNIDIIEQQIDLFDPALLRELKGPAGDIAGHESSGFDSMFPVNNSD